LILTDCPSFACNRLQPPRSPEYWRVTINHPPLNIFGPEMIPQVAEIISAIETDEQVKVVVFDSAVEGFVLIHLDFLAFKRPRTPTGNRPRRAPSAGIVGSK
jgi:enoyl-CoA hydratase/carnithine racemase